MKGLVWHAGMWSVDITGGSGKNTHFWKEFGLLPTTAGTRALKKQQKPTLCSWKGFLLSNKVPASMFKLCGSDLRSFKEKLQRPRVYPCGCGQANSVQAVSARLEAANKPKQCSWKWKTRTRWGHFWSCCVLQSLLRFIPTNCTSYFQFLFDASHFISQIKAGTLSHVSRLHFNVKLLA